jgi:hypothetical protein
MKNIHTKLFNLKQKAERFERENFKNNNFRGAGAVHLCVHKELIPEFEKQGFTIKVSPHWGNILFRFSTNGALQDIEDMIQEFIDENNEFYATTWLD